MVKKLTEEEAIAKCKYFGHITESRAETAGKWAFYNCERNFVKHAQTDDGVRTLNVYERRFKKSPAHSVMSGVKADEGVMALVFARWLYWSGGWDDLTENDIQDWLNFALKY